MNKDNYNIDEILSEVKKRKASEPPKDNEQINTAESTENEAPKAEINVGESLQFAKSEKAQEEAPKEAEPETTEPETTEPAAEAEEPEVTEMAVEDAEADEMVDILSMTEEEPEAESEKTEAEVVSEELIEEEEPAKKKKSKKKGRIILAIVALIVALSVVIAIIRIDDFLNIMTNNNGSVATTEKPWQGMDKLVEEFSPIDETEATQLASLKDMIKTWYYNGKPCSSSHVLNVLLIGEDTRGEEILDEGTRADSAIIVSVNIDTGVITLTSILRDAYTYWETTEGDESTGQFGKINGAMSTGDINAYINCVENMYKVKIDNYVIVNFDSFEKIVDHLGGVTLELTEAEINEINNHPKRYGNVTIEKTFEGSKGKIKLNGKQALAYCRIRKIDSDNMRADRQKTCMKEVFKQAKNAKKIDIIPIVKDLIPYVKTGFSKSEIVKIARYAISQGWLDYDIYMQNLPEHNLKGGTAFGAWVWKCDFPADAYNLQYIIYGKSNITLAHIRPDTAICPEQGFYSEGSSPMSSMYTIVNTHYGEETTVTTTTKKSGQ